jgi:glycosyltransferase involved in cell wall biosynthesis
MGGGRSHLLGLVPELAAIAPDARFLLVAQPDLLSELPPLPATWELQPERAEERTLLRRLAWEQGTLPSIARRWRAAVLLSFGSFVPLRAPCPTVIEAGNALPFTPGYWRVLRHEPARVRLEQAARWFLLKASLRSATRVLAPTRAMRQDVVAHLPELADRVDVVHWGVADYFRATRWSPPATPRLVGVSKHGVNKEFDVLVAALLRLLDRWPDLRLDLTGTPHESRWSRQTAALAERLEVADRVAFVGELPNDQVPCLLASASLLVFPTWCESFGLPLAEALALGAPAVAGDIPPCREVGCDAARYYHPGDPASLAAEITALLADPRAAAELAAKARARGDLFRWRKNAEGTWATLERAVSARR